MPASASLFEIIGAIPVAAPLPDVASHVVAAVPIRREGVQEVGSEPRLNDIAEPARIECGPGEVGVFVDCEEDQAQAATSACSLIGRSGRSSLVRFDERENKVR